MRSLIVLVALMALSMADDDFHACFEQAKAFKICAFQNANETVHKNMEQLKGFKAALDTCFEQDGVKGVCSMPTPPPKPAAGAVQHFQFPAPPPEASACFDGAKKEFMTCFKKEAGIPDDFKPPQGADAAHKPRHPMPFMGHPHFPHDPKEIDAMAVKICGGQEEAAKKLKECAFKQIQPFARALAGFANPMVIACQAGAECAKTNTISDSCKAKLEQGAKAFCTCRDSSAKFVQSSDSCQAARNIFKERHQAAVAEHVEQAAAAHHNMPPHPNVPVDFCKEGKKPADMCKEVLAKVEKFANATPKAQ